MNCSYLENVSLNEGLKGIGSFAFAETGLKRVVLPNSMGKMYFNSFDRKTCEVLNTGNVKEVVENSIFR